MTTVLRDSFTSQYRYQKCIKEVKVTGWGIHYILLEFFFFFGEA